MIEKALKYLVGLGEANIHRIPLQDGTEQVYSDKPLTMLDKKIYMAKSIEMSTLSSFVDYIKNNIDTMADQMIIHVVSPTEVRLYSALNEKREREYIAEVKAMVPEFPYERFMDHETFLISAQSKFLDDEKTDKALLLKFAGTVQAESIADYGDDGITQKATIKQGIASKTDAVVPNPVKLRPYRTFVEVEQPVSEFIFRMKDSNGIKCAIFEADGGAWKNNAMHNIKDYLEYELNDYAAQFTVIS